MYVFKGGWVFISNAWTKMGKFAKSSAQTCYKSANTLGEDSRDENWLVIFFAFIGIFFCFMTGTAIYIILIGAALLFVSVFGSVLAIMAGFCLTIIGTLCFSIWLYRSIWHISYDCPHPYCDERISLPIFICPNCQRRHSQLHPNTFGIWSHRCECQTKLPILDHFGRHKLVRRCPKCNNIINSHIGQNTNIHMPVIGGPSAGKTHYIVASTNELMNTYTEKHKYHFSFTEEHHKADFERNREKLTSGQMLAPTSEIAPPAVMLKMDIPGIPVSKMLYMYDAAGEAYNANARTSQQTYYKHICGLIFIIDPCAITQFQLKHEQKINAIAFTLRPSQSEIMQVHDRMMRMLERMHGIRRFGRYRFPIAIVVTKVDALGLEQIIGTDAARVLMSYNPSYATEDAAINALVKDFLRAYGLSDLLRNLEYHFSAVRYFSCSVLDTSTAQPHQSSLLPIRVLEPLSWLLSSARVIKQLPN
jgi:hypothetical protein